MQIILNKVLAVGTKTSTYIGKPVVPNAAVHAVVEEQVSTYWLPEELLDSYAMPHVWSSLAEFEQ